jgi:hypothetical protein
LLWAGLACGEATGWWDTAEYNILNISSMGGQHIRITVVHDPPGVDVGLLNGRIIRPKHEWTGFIIDMISQISTLANFTYELYLPSGSGSACKRSSQEDWATQYLCGQQDVLEQNFTDAYWSLYYVMGGRVEAGTRFSLPFLTNVGTSMLVQLGSADLKDTIFKLFYPYTPALWGYTFLALFFTSGVLFSIEQIRHPKREALRKVKWVKHREESKKTLAQLEILLARRARPPGGLFSGKKFPRFVMEQWQSLLRKRYNPNLGKMGLLLQLVWCFFSMVWVCSYLSQLTVRLTTEEGTVKYDSITQLVGVSNFSL